MLIHNATFTGSFAYNGVDISNISSSSETSASFASRVSSLESTASVLTSASSSLNDTSASLSTASGSLNAGLVNVIARTGSFATTGSNVFYGSQTVSASMFVSGSITATGQIVAQTINVQSVTSSVVYSSGSNVFGNDLSNSQTFTGSMLITGSMRVIGNACMTGTVCVGGQVCANSIGLPAGGTINNLSNIQYGGYTWAAYNTSDGTITLSNVSGCPIKFSTGEACFGSAINSPGGTISQDLRIYRSAGTTTGYINFGSTGTNYFGFDGTKYVANGALSATNGLFSGCIGVGTNAPITTLHISNSGNNFLTLERSTATNSKQLNINIESNSQTTISYDCVGGFVIGSSCNPNTQTGFNERLRISGNGIACFSCQVCAPNAVISNCLGVGVAVPQGNFEVAGLSYFTRASNSLLINPNYGGANTHVQLQVVCNMALAFATNGDNERMRITSGGNVGIGETTPQHALSIQRTGNVALHFSTNGCYTGDFIDITGGGQCTVTNGNSAFRIRSVVTAPSGKATGNLGFWVNCGDMLVERMHIGCTGNVGIGTTSPNYKLTVKEGGVAGAPLFAFIGNASNGNWMRGYWLKSDETTTIAQLTVQDGDAMYIGTATSIPFIMQTAGSERMRITSTGIACFACTVCAPFLRMICSTMSPVISIENSNTTNDAGVRSLAIQTDRLRFGVSPVTSTYGAIATNGTNSGITFVTYDNSWSERLRIECTGIVNFYCQICVPKTITNGTALFRTSIPTQGEFFSIQQSIGGCGFSAQAGGDYIHIKTNITKDDRMVGFNVRGYMYSPEPVDTDIAFYTYSPVSYVYSVSIYEKSYTGWNYCLYYSGDNKVVLVVQGSGTYGGFVLTGINTARYNQFGEMCILGVAHATCWCAQF